jgi:hypothetical protein
LQAIILDKKALDWLLEGPEWLKYAVELQLSDLKPDVTPVLRDSAIQKLVNRLKGNSAGIPAIKSGKVHYTEAGKAYWDLFFLADIGLSIKDSGLGSEAEEIFRFQSADGSFTIPANVRDNYFCMSAILLSSLARMGYRDDPRVIKYTRAAMSAQMPGGGWDCYGESFSAEGSCPMDDMNILMLLGQYLQYRENFQLHGAIDHLLEHWKERNSRYGFGVGKRFRSLQYPAVKYGILRVLDVLSLFPYAVKNQGFQSMLDFVHAKAKDGRYFAESTDMAYTDFDFSQTAEPSRWITFLVNRIDRRVKGLSQS